MTTPEDVLEFWLDKVGPEGWYKQDDALDQQIRDRFLSAWEEAARLRPPAVSERALGSRTRPGRGSKQKSAW